MDEAADASKLGCNQLVTLKRAAFRLGSRASGNPVKTFHRGMQRRVSLINILLPLYRRAGSVA